jgi:hypothetical protein
LVANFADAGKTQVSLFFRLALIDDDVRRQRERPMRFPFSEVDDPTTAVVDLSRFDDDYRRAQIEPDSTPVYVSVPDGKYRVMIENVELTTAKTSGNPLLKWRLRITGEDQKHRVLFKSRAITASTIDWVKKEMNVLGVELEPFSSLPQKLGELLNVELMVSKVTKGEYENIYFNKRLTPHTEDKLAELSDDLPF